ncbi:DUF899 domain-containing protein [Rhizohabitans arisaemae]|uniref:DUF899 domain-containing protein n=1 Tax=Rhizohabitans arisaemae TaxID=2720610 RepID=UPI0024B1236C|nr:DUF899 domain-containing protein [Rhizohabitans arisaemae]
MNRHKIGTRDEWRAARIKLLEAEKELTRRSDELTRQRQELPWVPVEKEYRLEGPDGPVSLRDLFEGRSQLIVYHFMSTGCPSCSSFIDSLDGTATHLRNHDVVLACVLRNPIDEVTAFRKRMGWQVPFYSSPDGEFKVDFGTSFTDELAAEGPEYNYYRLPPILPDPSIFPRDMPGLTSFVLEDDVVYHTYSSYSRGNDVLWSMFQVLDRAPKGRRDHALKLRLHDEYGEG